MLQAEQQSQSRVKNLAPWELADQQRREQQAERRFQEEDFDFVLGRDTSFIKGTFPKVNLPFIFLFSKATIFPLHLFVQISLFKVKVASLLYSFLNYFVQLMCNGNFSCVYTGARHRNGTTTGGSAQESTTADR